MLPLNVEWLVRIEWPHLIRHQIEWNSLGTIQIDIVNAYPSADRQAQFDVPAGRASKSYDNGHVQLGDDIPCSSSLWHYWSVFESMQGTTSTLHFSDYQGQAHKIACSKGDQQGDAFETVRFAVTTFPSFGRVFARHAACTGAAICDDVTVFIVAPLAEGLALAAELKAESWPRSRCAQIQLLLSGWSNQRNDHARALFSCFFLKFRVQPAQPAFFHKFRLSRFKPKFHKPFGLSRLNPNVKK